MLNNEEGDKIKILLAIDEKTQRGNSRNKQKANHIVSTVDERGICLGQKRVDGTTNEIKAVPKPPDGLNIKRTIITTDAMGTQIEIMKKIKSKGADHLLALKGNQESLLEDIKMYFSDKEVLIKSDYKKTVKKARG